MMGLGMSLLYIASRILEFSWYKRDLMTQET